MVALLDTDKQQIETILLNNGVLSCAYYFGSRVHGTHTEKSDIDICLKPTNETIDISKIKQDFSDSNISILTDIIIWDKISPSFQNIIKNDLCKVACDG